jgi:hypothetical protein
VELTMELSVTAERIEGTVRPVARPAVARPAVAFSGWSELFAALLTVISETGDDGGQDRGQAARLAGDASRNRPRREP